MAPNTVLRAPFLICLLLFIMFFENGAPVEVTVPRDPVMQLIGSNVELPCHYKTSVDKNFMLEWRFAPNTTSPDLGKQMAYFTNNALYKPGSQSERISLLHDPPTLGDASIRLNNVRASDAGTYICEVNNPPDFYGTSSGLIHFTVLMPPSTPVCQGTTSVSVGSDASLSCSSSEGVPAPVYSWTRLDSKVALPVSNMVQNDRTGSLILTNVSLAFTGTYQCVSSNEYGKHSCQITLHVTGTANAGAIAGAVIGVILALLLLGAIVIYVMHQRKRKMTKKSQSAYSGNEIREDATAPGISKTSLQGPDSESEESHPLKSIPSRSGSPSITKSQPFPV